MKYLMKFNTQEEYNAYAATLDDTNTPNISVLASSTSTTSEIFSTQQLPHNYSKDYLTFTALQNTTFKFTTNPLEYSIDDGQTWTSLAANTASPTVTAGDKILWKKTGLTPNSDYGIGTFSATGNFNVSGNIMSLLFGDNFIGQTSLIEKYYAFRYLFNGNTKLINAENLVLPATTLAYYCYDQMFQGCTSLTTAPELPATTLVEYCYYYMFQGCTALTTAPELPATTLTSYCYRSMFNYCTNLNYIKCLATDISASSCTTGWVNNVAATGTFVKDASITSWSTGTSGIPSGWTVQDAA